jgi:hypothetical protein
MTSVEFSVKNAISPNDNFFLLEPIIVAFKSHPYFAVTYMPYGQYEFQGLRQWRDKFVEIYLDNRSSTGSNSSRKRIIASYTYHIRIFDGSFQKLNLPLFQPPEAQTRVAASAQTHRGHGIKMWQAAIIALAAVCISFTVYFITSRKMQ